MISWIESDRDEIWRVLCGEGQEPPYYGRCGGPAVFCRGFLNRFFGDPCESGSHEAGVADQLPK